jgi:ATP-dependent Lhr-like helicase
LRLDGRRPVASADGLHDLLLALGDLSEAEIRLRSEPAGDAAGFIAELSRARRIFSFCVGSERRYAAAEDAGRLSDALGISPPPDVPEALLAKVEDPLGDIVSRYARTHGPFRLEEAAARFGLGAALLRQALARLADKGRVIEGEFTPGRTGGEFCDAEVLRALKRRSLAKLRKEIEPVPAEALGRFLVEWQGLIRPRAGTDALLMAIEQLEGAPIPVSVLESDVLPARVAGYRPGDLDQLCAAGEVIWVGVEPLGPHDGRVTLFLVDQLPLLAPPPRPAEGALAARLRALFERRGALFFADLVAETGVFPGDLIAALWELIWAGEMTNDTLAPLRSIGSGASTAANKQKASRGRAYLTRRGGARIHGTGPLGRPSLVARPPGSEGRWSLITRPRERPPSETERRAALARTLLERHGVLTREAAQAEGIPGGFGAVYEVLKAMEESGRVRRGYFVEGLGAAQFALPGADDRLRALRNPAATPKVLVIAATDPANPYGAALAWPEPLAGDAEARGPRPQRAAGAHVILEGGRLLGYLGRTDKDLLTFLPEESADRGRKARALALALAALVEEGRRRTLLIARIDGADPAASPLGDKLAEAGFTLTSKGYFKRGYGPRQAG